MHLASQETSFQLTIVDYQFPELADADYDSNWLNIRIDATIPSGSWTATDPSLLTYEVAQLADWLEMIANDTPTAKVQDFIEPNLSFEIVQNSFNNQVLRVYFELEMRPFWAETNTTGAKPIWAEFALLDLNLTEAARELRAQLQHYPQRARR